MTTTASATEPHGGASACRIGSASAFRDTVAALEWISRRSEYRTGPAAHSAPYAFHRSSLADHDGTHPGSLQARVDRRAEPGTLLRRDASLKTPTYGMEVLPCPDKASTAIRWRA